LEYIRYFSDEARGLIRLGGRTVLLSRAVSAQMFAELLRPFPPRKRTLLQLIARAHLRPQSVDEFRGSVLFNTGHSGLDQVAYGRHLRKLEVKPMVLVHDLIPITHPEYCRPGERQKHIARMENALGLANGIIVNSAATMNELQSYARKLGKAMPATATALLAPASMPSPASVRPIAAPYFVMLSTIEPRKNHWMILQVWDKLVERYGDQAPRLVLVGRRGWECENVVDLLERRESLRGVVSDLPVFREIAGDIPDYLDPLDGMGWMGKIEAYIDNESPQRLSQLRKVGDFNAPTWASHFDAVETLLERLT